LLVIESNSLAAGFVRCPRAANTCSNTHTSARARADWFAGTSADWGAYAVSASFSRRAKLD
jgi:hypothetical protein